MVMMNNHFSMKQIVVLVGFIAFMTACLTQIPEKTATITLSPTEKLTSTTISSATKTTSPTNILVISPTLEPTYLSIQKPSIEQLDEYLSEFFDENYFGLSQDTVFIYEDVNGDDDPDLIVDDRLQVVIFIRVNNDRYSEPFRIVYPYWKYDPSSRVFLEDWTNDGVPEVIFDYRGDTGGTGIIHQDWYRHIVRCQNVVCSIIWSEKFAGLTLNNSLGGMDLYKATTQLQNTPNGELELAYLSGMFAVYSSDAYLNLEIEWDDHQYAQLHVYTSTLSSYIWNGNEFELSQTEIVRIPYTVEGQASLSANGPKYVLATITVEPNFSADQSNDVCQLIVDGKPTGYPFGCKDNFTTIEWRDITGDSVPEIIVRALSGAKPVDKELNQLSAVNCVHQRFLVYSWDGKDATEIANIAGCIVDESIFGARLQDYTGDGVLEIITPSSLYYSVEGCEIEVSVFEGGGCWYEVATDPGLRIYKYNGTKYELWSEIPSQ